MGVSDDDAVQMLIYNEEAKRTIRDVLGVDLTSLAYRGKFVFVAQVGSPQKVAMELRDNSTPFGLGMDVLITGRLQQRLIRNADAFSFVTFVPHSHGSWRCR